MKATLHWVSAEPRSTPKCGSTTGCSPVEKPGAEGDFRTDLNPASLEVRTREARAVAPRVPRRATRFQFERLGYFCVDPDSRDGRLVFNRTVTLKDTWAKLRRADSSQEGRNQETLSQG